MSGFLQVEDAQKKAAADKEQRESARCDSHIHTVLARCNVLLLECPNLDACE